ncbi:hypothetical protein SADUNF_Sadunf07G0015300 [Salix dunnii]|uniref:Methyltransferase n=1 Tax=Salix dunnii TaxID=1413687 RepID=A0A835JZ09_9ROSI|nr:hypothetical protein SADUNF_Sadunf07G0015300 [Salix dunnii]
MLSQLNRTPDLPTFGFLKKQQNGGQGAQIPDVMRGSFVHDDGHSSCQIFDDLVKIHVGPCTLSPRAKRTPVFMKTNHEIFLMMLSNPISLKAMMAMVVKRKESDHNEKTYEEQQNEQSQEDSGGQNSSQESQNEVDSNIDQETKQESSLGESAFPGGKNLGIPKESKESWSTQAAESKNQKERRKEESYGNDSMYGYTWQLCNVTVKVTGEFLTFPSGGTQFMHEALHYIDFVQQAVPKIKWGKHPRVILDVGCGVASFGGYIVERDVLIMSFAPKNEHEAQVQFALERGIPVISIVTGSRRLPFPSWVFDLIHCARCRVPWHVEGHNLFISPV